MGILEVYEMTHALDAEYIVPRPSMGPKSGVYPLLWAELSMLFSWEAEAVGTGVT